MKAILTSLVLTFYSTIAYCTTVTILNSGSTFSPSTVTINEGDTVLFSLSSIHNVLEVSQTTWSANGNTQLPGGFLTPFGGGLVLPSKLTVGTHWYVCQPHASMGMKGRIIVLNTSAISENQFSWDVSAFPNPVTSEVTVKFGKAIHGTLQLYNVLGEILIEEHVDTDSYSIYFGSKPKGIYFITVADEAGNKIELRIVKM